MVIPHLYNLKLNEAQARRHQSKQRTNQKAQERRIG